MVYRRVAPWSGSRSDRGPGSVFRGQKHQLRLTIVVVEREIERECRKTLPSGARICRNPSPEGGVVHLVTISDI